MLFGKTIRNTGPIKLAEWNEIISSHSSLIQAPEMEMTNPFTQKKSLHRETVLLTAI